MPTKETAIVENKETLERLADPEVQEALRFLRDEKGITFEQIREAYEWLDQHNSETPKRVEEQSWEYRAKLDARGNLIRLDWVGAHKIQHLHSGSWPHTHTFWMAQIEVNQNKVGIGRREEGTDQRLDCEIDFAMFGTRKESMAFARDYLAGERWKEKREEAE